jgi:membrane protease YdiL (CAAX protease family)
VRPRRGRPAAEAAAAGLGMVLLALGVHQGFPWILIGIAGILMTAHAVQRSFSSLREIPPGFGLSAPKRRVFLFSIAGCGLGVGLGILYRVSFDMTALPGPAFGPFALIACAVGAAEEILYRGWMQGRLRSVMPGVPGMVAAVIFAAAAHAAYKTALFALPPANMGFDYVAIAVLTLGGGALFGLLRELSDNVIPAVAAHAAFDLIVYGAATQAPWWVWA